MRIEQDVCTSRCWAVRTLACSSLDPLSSTHFWASVQLLPPILAHDSARLSSPIFESPA